MSSDHLTDSLGRQWVLGPVLGRGTWGRSRVVRDAEGREMVLKEPLTNADFSADAPLPEDLLEAARNCARQQVALLEESSQHYLPKLESTIELGAGRVGLVLPRYTTLERRLEAGAPLGDLLRLVYRISLTLAESQTVHGNIKPANIVFGDRGEAFLTDPLTKAHHPRLFEHAGCGAWTPPEVHRSAESRTRSPLKPSATWDTWALCQLVYAVIMATPQPERREQERREQEREPGFRASLSLEPGGLDKIAVAHLKEAVLARLGFEGSNPRFRARVVDRLGALLARGLSPEHEPSPPFRFATARDLADRVNEVLALLRPKVVEVGKVLFPANAADGIFRHGSEISFSVTVGCTHGITDHDDLVCGLQLVDLDAPEDGPHARKPVDDARMKLQVHPSGRLRFQLTIPEISPGRFRVRVAFAIKDSGDDPQVAVGDLEVRPPPGYIPPRQETGPASPLPFRAGSGPPAKPGPLAGDERAEPAARQSGVQLAQAGTTQPGPALSRTPSGNSPQTHIPQPHSPLGAMAERAKTPPRVERASTPEPARGRGMRMDGLEGGLLGASPREVRAPQTGKDGVVVGLFPRPVRPPDDEMEPDEPTPSQGLRVVQPELSEPSEAVLASSPSRSPSQRSSDAPPAVFRADTGPMGDAAIRRGAGPPNDSFRAVSLSPMDASDLTVPAPDTWPPPAASPGHAGQRPQLAHSQYPPSADDAAGDATPEPAVLRGMSPSRTPGGLPGSSLPGREPGSRDSDPRLIPLNAARPTQGRAPLSAAARQDPLRGSMREAHPPQTLGLGLEDEKTRPGPGTLPTGNDDLPAAGDELPSIVGLPRPGRTLPAPVAQLLELIRSDTYVALGAAIAACLVLLLVMAALLKAC